LPTQPDASGSLTLSELERKLRKKGIPARKAHLAVRAFFDALKQALARGEEVEIGGLALRAKMRAPKRVFRYRGRGRLNRGSVLEGKRVRAGFITFSKVYVSAASFLVFVQEPDGTKYVEESHKHRLHSVFGGDPRSEPDLSDESVWKSRFQD
jgi:hypothetical protein